MNRIQLLGLLVKHTAQVTGRPVAEVADLLSDQYGAVDMLDQLGMDWGRFSRIIDRMERDLRVSLSVDIWGGRDSTRDNLLDAMEKVLAKAEEGQGSGLSFMEGVSGALVRDQLVNSL